MGTTGTALRYLQPSRRFTRCCLAQLVVAESPAWRLRGVEAPTVRHSIPQRYPERVAMIGLAHATDRSTSRRATQVHPLIDNATCQHSDRLYSRPSEARPRWLSLSVGAERVCPVPHSVTALMLYATAHEMLSD